MATYEYQIEATKAANIAARAISDAAQVRIQDIADELFRNKITINQFEIQTISVVRDSYNESSLIARQLTQQLSELSGWVPFSEGGDTPYLKSLISDVQRNVQIFKESEQDNKAFRNLSLRTQLSAITGSARGFTDSQLTHYEELQDLGFSVRKLWLANFINNEPCSDCIHLHGTKVPFKSEFPIPTLMKTAVYRDLQGPPLHPRCKCTMVVLISTLANAFETVDIESPTNPTTIDTKTVKRFPARIFDAIIKVLQTITGTGRK